MIEIISNKQPKYTPISNNISIPFDIIENNILPRLPVKSLLRFRAVSKQWEATISHPRFVETHRQQYSKNSSSSSSSYSSRNLFAREAADELHVVNLENDKFRILSKIPYPPEGEKYLRSRAGILCHCDGLFLKRCRSIITDNEMMYLLWNPSTRRYKKFHCPYPLDYFFTKILYGLCYDPLMKDYKVVIADMEHYAVFYCRNNKWSEMKERKQEFSQAIGGHGGVSSNGSIYWFVTTKRSVEDDFSRLEIVCFDAREEKFKKLPMLDSSKGKPDDLFCFTSMGGHLCLFPRMAYVWRNEMRIMKKVSDDKNSWMELKVQLPISSCPYVIPLCFRDEDEIILEVGDPKNYILYNQSKKTFADIQKISAGMFPRLVPYQENLFSL